jgi:hypothetical protein
MKHSKITLAILAMLSASIALADDFKTIDGKEYKNVTVKRVEPDGLVLGSKSESQRFTSLNCLKKFSSASITTLIKPLHTQQSKMQH